ncbi:MAG TPA: lipid II flippase MurJ [Nocardioidaceae bacterium]|nr:lipid II flippase MurJ [Nocardioidaceae bacterium]
MNVRKELRAWRGTLLGAAALITVLTVLARTTGFGRNLVFARTVGATCLNSTYQTVNTVPNILYEVVAGGALASLVVPLLARAVAAGDRDHVDRTASALITWTLVVLTPLALVIALAAEPITRLMLGDGSCDGAVGVGASMLRVFAPQVVLYGVGIVLTGILQAHRKFGGPALAPLLSSLVVIGAYLTYALVAPRGTDIDTLTKSQELILSVGTTLGVVALSLSLLVPISRLGLRLRPTFGFPDGVAPHVRSLAIAGMAALAAQQASIAVVLLLGNQASDVAVAVYTQAQAIYFLPWAVLAVPVATTVFPRLAERWSAGDRDSYRAQLAASTQIVVLLSMGAAAAMVAAARPLARVIFQNAPGVDSVDALAEAVIGFAAGLVGYGLFALLSRALYAARTMAATAIACVSGWAAVVVADLILSAAMPKSDRVLALALGNSIGMTVLGAALVVVVLRRAGSHAVSGVAKVAAAGAVAAVLAGWLGWLFERQIDSGGVALAVVQGFAAATVAIVIFAAIVAFLVRAAVSQSLSTLRGSRARPSATLTGSTERDEGV